jgi:hypothetical protein
LYGYDVAKKWTPRLAVYDLINHQVAAKPGAVYDWHHDSKFMLTDNRQEMWGDFYLCVPTFVITNAIVPVAGLCFRTTESYDQEGGGVSHLPGCDKIMLAPQALHYQQEGSNDGFQHKPEIEKNPPQFLTRWVITSGRPSTCRRLGMRN